MWKDDYLLGDALIDEQHKGLFDATLTLLDSLKTAESREDYKKYLGDSLAFVKSYALKHFSDEEEYARSIGFPGAEEHKKIHDKLVQDVLRFEKELVDSDFANPVVKRFLGFLITWLTYHVAGEDQKIRKDAAIQAAAPDGAFTGIENLFAGFADNARDVLKIMTGMKDSDINNQMKSNIHANPDVCFKVGLVGDVHKAVGYIYSKEIAFGAFKAMTGMEVSEINEIIYSALQELSNIFTSKLSSAIAGKGMFCDIETPSRVDILPVAENRFSMLTPIGNMEIILIENDAPPPTGRYWSK